MYLLLRALPLNWIHSKINSEATVCIIGLIAIAFRLLDWIYRSIRIMMVVRILQDDIVNIVAGVGTIVAITALATTLFCPL